MHDDDANGREADNELSVDVLGPIRARFGDQEIALGPARQRAVFAVLAMRANRVVSRKELIEAVWGDAPPASAQGSVYTYICGLRRSLEPRRSRWSPGDLLTGDRVGYVLRLAPGALDAERFDELRHQAHGRLEGHDPARAVEDLNAALALWRGNALSGVPGPFAETVRERLGELRLVTTESWGAAMLAAGGQPELATELASLVRAYPLRESLRASLMVALYWSGRHVEALEVFREARRALVNELGIEPGPALRKVHEQILAGDPALDPPASLLRETVPQTAPKSGQSASPEAAPVPAPRVAMPTRQEPGRPPAASRATRRVAAGHAEQTRSAELGQLRALVENLRAGHGGSVWVEGEKDTGCAELLHAALADVGGDGAQIAWAVADEFSRRSPLRVMLDCLGVSADALLANAAGIGWRQPGGGIAPRTWSDGDPVVVGVNQLLSIVETRCAKNPMVLVVDDLQWADEATIMLWHRLSVATRQLPLLLVAGSRPAKGRGDIARLRAGIQRRGGNIIDLTPLPTDNINYLAC
ncbi:MAG TPA: BTAD domain-containing putative transcriptional regulator [Pseudonocardiaceae bacterium]|jgi:DNA-binding SARP family transcriptional activator|nr:BTAD domain-containing putative transcriptional regulator [Pseudonocardiaceae bacterium]